LRISGRQIKPAEECGILSVIEQWKQVGNKRMNIHFFIDFLLFLSENKLSNTRAIPESAYALPNT